MVKGLRFEVCSLLFASCSLHLAAPHSNLRDPSHDVRRTVTRHDEHAAAGARRQYAPRELARADVVGGTDVGEVQGDAGGEGGGGGGGWGWGLGLGVQGFNLVIL